MSAIIKFIFVSVIKTKKGKPLTSSCECCNEEEKLASNELLLVL